jgi:molybdopterin synthase sulfur carrier subunit
MAADLAIDDHWVGSVTVRYWAAARAAAGVDSDEVPVAAGATVGDVLGAVQRLHADRPRLRDVVAVCSVLVEDRPLGTRDPDAVPISPGQTVELLPPFAGG